MTYLLLVGLSVMTLGFGINGWLAESQLHRSQKQTQDALAAFDQEKAAFEKLYTAFSRLEQVNHTNEKTIQKCLALVRGK